MQVVWADRRAGKREMQRDQSNGSIRCKRRDASIAGSEHEVTPRRHSADCVRFIRGIRTLWYLLLGVADEMSVCETATSRLLNPESRTSETLISRLPAIEGGPQFWSPSQMRSTLSRDKRLTSLPIIQDSATHELSVPDWI